MAICEYSSNLKLAVAQVNSKNTFGGYTGFQGMLVMETEGVQKAVQIRSVGQTLPELRAEKRILQLAVDCMGRWRAKAVPVLGEK